MIFVTVGTHEQQFNRLVAGADALAATEECIVQYGHSNPPQRAVGHAFMPFEDVEKHMRAARTVVTHAGTGTVMFALSLGKTPVVVPRLARFAEHVDDHQLELVTSLAELGLIVPCMPEDNLAKKIEQAAAAASHRKIEPDANLVSYLDELIRR